LILLILDTSMVLKQFTQFSGAGSAVAEITTDLHGGHYRTLTMALILALHTK
jgi:hypothetical protein